jgi:bla regulator protein BlaR1
MQLPRALIMRAILLVSCVSAAWAQAPTQSVDKPKFEVASIKISRGAQRPGPPIEVFEPGGRYVTGNLRLRDILESAYHLTPYQWAHISGGPNWLPTEFFDIEAKADGTPTREQMVLMLQSLLADRLHLMVHWEAVRGTLLVLTVAKPGKLGPQLHPHTDDSNCGGKPEPLSSTIPVCGDLRGLNSLSAYKVTMDDLTTWLGNLLQDSSVINRTGLKGAYDLSLSAAILQGGDSKANLNPTAVPTDPTGPPWLFDALQDQLGLKLVPEKGPIEILVIDHVEEPSPN